jgi:hypothetical protein
VSGSDVKSFFSTRRGPVAREAPGGRVSSLALGIAQRKSRSATALCRAPGALRLPFLLTSPGAQLSLPSATPGNWRVTQFVFVFFLTWYGTNILD